MVCTDCKTIGTLGTHTNIISTDKISTTSLFSFISSNAFNSKHNDNDFPELLITSRDEDVPFFVSCEVFFEI